VSATEMVYAISPRRHQYVRH